jgi:glycosyltransferase involved in cell wall biosynthesis
VSYIGRQDSEKGIDLLVYAAKILEHRGLPVQLAICGSTCFGDHYREAVRQIAEHLRLTIHHAHQVPESVRNALYAHSRCVVYPPIHREPFGLVAVEAMSYGTPVIVPDQGGIVEAIEANGRRGGLTFRAWDSGDLALQLERILTDDDLHRRLSDDSRCVAAHFSVQRMTDAVLGHMGLPAQQLAPPAPI